MSSSFRNLPVQRTSNFSAQDLMKHPTAKIMHGLLRKRPGSVGFGEWPFRFIILTKDTLYVYFNEKAPSARTISLQGYNAVARVENKYHECCFAVVPAVKTANLKPKVFACLDDEDRKRWMQAIREQLYVANNIDKSRADSSPYTPHSISSCGSDDEFLDLERLVFHVEDDESSDSGDGYELIADQDFTATTSNKVVRNKLMSFVTMFKNKAKTSPRIGKEEDFYADATSAPPSPSLNKNQYIPYMSSKDSGSSKANTLPKAASGLSKNVRRTPPRPPSCSPPSSPPPSPKAPPKAHKKSQSSEDAADEDISVKPPPTTRNPHIDRSMSCPPVPPREARLASQFSTSSDGDTTAGVSALREKLFGANSDSKPPIPPRDPDIDPEADLYLEPHPTGQVTLVESASVVDSTEDPEELKLKLIKKNTPGTYMIRKSTKDDSRVVMLLENDGKVSQYKIMGSPGAVTFGDDNTFDSLELLLEYYTHTEKIPGSDFYLGLGYNQVDHM